MGVTAMANDTYPVQWTGQQAVVTLPRHIDASCADPIREQLLWLINRGAVVLVADLTGTVSCDYSGADALARAQQRATANGTELRLVVTAEVVRRVLSLNGFDRLVAVYPDLEAATAAGTGRYEQETGAPAARTDELLDTAVASIFDVGLILQAAVDVPSDVTAQRIAEALCRLDDLVQDIRNHMLARRGHRSGPSLAWMPRPHVLERSARAMSRSELLQGHVAHTARAVQAAAADTAALLERRADLLVQPWRIDYPTEIKKWRAVADQARQLAERLEQPP